MANFQRTLSAVAKGQVIIPHIRAEMAAPGFKGFDVTVRGWREGHREFDGWFHPSTHATWTARQLALYLMHGSQLPQERPDVHFVLAVTQGSFWHELVQRILLRGEILRRNPGTKWKDPIEQQVEIPIRDPHHNILGHADGRMVTADDELFEFKTTSSDRVVKSYRDGGEAYLREKNPYGYYSQAQDYLAVTGLAKTRYLVLGMVPGFPMEEFVVHADPRFQAAQRAKYRTAIEHASRGTLPEACCGIGSKESKTCPAARFCPIGKVTT